MARTRKSEIVPIQEKQAGDAAVMVSPVAMYPDAAAGESEPMWIWELED